jgi:exopolysaccharide production protein ExoY
MTGFVHKNGRLTKGGSLPSKVGARKIRSFVLRYFPRENGANGGAEGSGGDMTLLERFNSNGHNGNGNGNGNGSDLQLRTSRNGADSIDNECSPFPQKVMGDLVSSGNGNGATRKSSGHSYRSGRSRVAALNHSRVTHDFEQCLLPFGEQKEIASTSSATPLWKRILDLTCVGLTLPVWLPLMMLVMIWIKLVSPGPVFFRQPRVGYRRRHFMIFKFRTMHVNAETKTHAEYFAHLMRADCPMTKLDQGDPRLIACGRFLRASGLDELPQIFNVIWGNMTLVGPRPCLPHEFEKYELWQQQRVNVLPGLTGYWQVNGKNQTTFSEMIAMDLLYARNMSLGLDLAIIFKTIPALLRQTLESRAVSRVGSRQPVLYQAPQ